MRQPGSIRFHLSAVFFFFFLLVAVLGLFSIMRLHGFDRVSSDIVDLWLPNTRALGDLNNFTSDFRAAEGSSLLATRPGDVAAIEREMGELDGAIAEAQARYERIRHDAAESALYARFKAHGTADPRAQNRRRARAGACRPQGRGDHGLHDDVARRL